MKSRDQLRTEAIERQDKRARRTPAEQLARLESRGFGHCAEAVKLRNAVAQAAKAAKPKRPKGPQDVRVQAS